MAGVNRGGSNWWVPQQPFNGASGGATYGGGGDAITYRYELDARRSMAGRESQYPDGLPGHYYRPASG